MCTLQVALLTAIFSTLHIQARAQGFYSTYNTPYQNSFAFATPNLKQVFTTKLAGPQPQISQEQVLQNQNLFNFNQQPNLPQNSYPASNNVYSTAPQQFASQEDQLRQQLAYYQQQQLQQQLQLQQLQQQQQQQQQQQYLEQFQAPFVPSPSQRDNNVDRSNQREEVRTQQLLGVAYSPSTQVSQVKFDNGRLKYDF